MSKPLESSSQRAAVLNKINGLLTSSYGVAAIASLSFHVVLFAAIPRFSSASFAAFDESSNDAPRTVPLVTLSPAEQSRLPDFNRRQLPAISGLGTPPSPGRLRTPTTFQPNTNLFDRSSSSRRSTPPNLPRRLNPNVPFTRRNFDFRTFNPPSRSGQSSEGRTAEVSGIPPIPPTVIPGQAERDLELELALEEQQAAEAAAEAENEPASNLPPLPESSEEPSESEGSEPDGENPEIAANPEATTQLTLLERLKAKYNYDPTNTTSEEVAANYEAWDIFIENEIDVPVDIAEPVELAVDASQNLCNQTPAEDGEIGLLVAPDGTPGDAVVLRSTGYEYLNQAALDALVNADDFPETENPVRYPVEIVVNDDCRSVEKILEPVRSDNEETLAEEE